MELHKINGRPFWLKTQKLEIKKGESGRWFVKTDDDEFMVRGGKAAGGSHFDWWVFWGDVEFPVKSLAHGIRAVVNKYLCSKKVDGIVICV